MTQVTIELPEHLWEFAEDEGRALGQPPEAFVAELLRAASERRAAEELVPLLAEGLATRKLRLTPELKEETLAWYRDRNRADA